VSSVLFFCLPVKLKLLSEVDLPDHAGWSQVLISPAESCATLQLQLFGQLLPQHGGAVQFWVWPLVQEISSAIHYCLALEVAFCCVCLLCFCAGIYFFAPPPSLGQVQCSINSLCMTVHCLFFSFEGQFSFGCCSLAQEMSSVIHFLPAHSQPSCLSCVCLLIVWY
jgi:hypothetical protein